MVIGNSNPKKKICLFSGKRGGFGAYLRLLRLIEASPDMELQILLGDMHASEKFGLTAGEVKKFFPNSQIRVVEMGAGRGDSKVIRVENLGVGLQKMAKALDELRPDILMVHGDRGEHLTAALAAVNLDIPVAHTQGGDVSGNIDDIQRHAISKLAHFHFPETAAAAARLKKIGEEEWRIKVVGSLYIDRIVKKMYLPNKEARAKYGLSATEDYALFIYHPDTYETPQVNYQAAKNALAALKQIRLKVLIFYPCSDPGYESVLRAIDEVRQDAQFRVYKNVENLDFLGLMAGAKVLVGNSSCALVEAPYFQMPAVNIGKRQEGRDREENVVDSDAVLESIKEKIDYVLNNKTFCGKLNDCGRRLGDGRSAERIFDELKGLPIDKKLLRKKVI